MALYFTRRSYNAQKKTFTNNLAALTRYVALDSATTGRSLSCEDWLPRVQAEMQSQDITIYVHGFNTTQAVMLDRRAKLETGLRLNGYGGAVVAYDWPSDGTVFTYDGDRTDAKNCAACLVREAILPLLTLKPKPRINLVAHSMGTYLTLRALSEFGDAAGPDEETWMLNEIAFVAGDADSNWFAKGARGSLLLAHRATRFTNYFSHMDDILNLPAIVGNGFRKRVGRVGMPSLVEDTHFDIYSHEQYLRDVPPSRRSSSFSHSWWFENAAWMRDLALTLSGTPDAEMPTRQSTDRARRALLS
jgi:esterase/lipase superfamily enzyme